MGDPVPRIGRVQRHIGGAGLEHRQRPDHQIGGAFDIEPHMGAGFDADLLQLAGQGIGPGVEARVAVAFAFKHQGCGLWRAGNLGLKCRLYGFFGRQIAGGLVPVFQQHSAFCFRQDRQIRQGAIPARAEVRCDDTQRAFKPRGEQLRGLSIEPGVIYM